MKHFLYLSLVLLSFTFPLKNLLAQQAEIAVSSKVEIKTYTEKEIANYQLKSDNPRTGAMIRKEDAVKRLFRDQVKNSYYEILTRLGKNADIRFVKEFNPSTTNFILRIDFSIMIDEVPMDVSVEGQKRKDGGGYNHGIYYMRVIFELDDPHTATIVTMDPMYRTKFWSNNYLSAEYLFNEFWLSFLKTALPRTNADALSPLIKKVIGNHEYSSLKYETMDNKQPKADGKQEGTLSVKLYNVLGEAREHSITRYKLTCKKGTFLETNSKEIEFTGADYYFEKHGGVNRFKTRYRSYNCKDFPEGEKETDTFILTQIATLNDKSVRKVTSLVVHFKCEKTYDIYAYYNAPGFVKAGVVWRNNTIRFPDKDNQPQVFDVMAYERGGERGEPKGTDGKPLKIPYSMTMPMIGKQTFYGHPENEYETPEVLYLKSLGGPNGIPAFELNKKHDALNSCHIVRTNGGPIYLELSFDLNGISGDVKMQYAIRSINNTLGHMNLPAFPTNFKPIRFSTEDIEHFKKFEKVEKTISNGKATLKVKFVPHQQKNPN